MASILDLFRLLATTERKLASNFVVLAASQSVNLLTPLVITPFYIKTLGLERYGVVFLCQILAIYMQVIMDYHYNLLGVRDLAQNRCDSDFIRKRLAKALSTRVVLLLASAGIMLTIIHFFPLLEEHRIVAYQSLTLLVGQFFLSPWIYQGLGEINVFAAVTVLSKACYVLSAILIIGQPADYGLPCILLGASNALFGAAGLVFLACRHGVPLGRADWQAVGSELREGRHIFVSNIAISVYSNTSAVILGLFGNPIAVSYFAVAERLIAVVRGFLSVFFQVTFPRVSHLAGAGKDSLRQLMSLIYIPFLIGVAGLSLTLFVFSDMLAFYFVRNQGLAEVSRLIRWFSVVPIIVSLNIPFYQLLLIHSHSKTYSAVLITASLLMITASITLTAAFSAFGTVCAIILTECFVTISLFYFARVKYELL